MVQYSSANYVLQVVSVVLFVSFLVGIILLLAKERQRVVRAKEEHRRLLLARRRLAISGQPRQPPLCDDIYTNMFASPKIYITGPD